MDVFRSGIRGEWAEVNLLLSCGALAVPAVCPFYVFVLLLVQLLRSVSVLRHVALPALPTLWCGGLQLSALELN